LTGLETLFSVVEGLFFNTPVRYKFLKKDFTETGYIEDVITRIALVNKDISLKLINTGKTIIQTNGNGNMESLIYSIYGKDIAKGITEVEYLYEDIKVTGVVGKAEIARSNRSHQLFFVNNRYVKDKNLSAAVEQSYKGLLPSGKYGFVILNLEIDPKKVDVNVHPAKLEVRFEEEGKVFKAIYHSIKAGLAQIEQNEIVSSNVNVIKKEDDVEIKEEKKDDIKVSEVKKEEFKPRSNAFSGFFKKLIKEQEETKEEIENNNLRDIFENKKNAKDRLFEDFSRTKNEEAIKKAGVIENEDGGNESVLSIENNKKNEDKNSVLEEKEGIFNNIATENKIELNNNIDNNFLSIDNEVYNDIEKKNVEDEIDNVDSIKNKEDYDFSNVDKKEVKLGNTIISSDTKELEVNVNDLIKQETLKIETIKSMQKGNSDTEIVSNLKELSNLPNEETISIEPISKLDKNNFEDAIEEKSAYVEKKEEIELNNPKNIDTVTEKILKMKIESNIDDTQLIDTAKVRSGIEDSKEPLSQEFANMYKRVFGMDVSSIRKTKEQEEAKLNASETLKYANEENLSVFENESTYFPEIKYKYIGIIFDTYIIIEIKNEMYMIDCNAAEERIIYEKVKANYYNDLDKDSQFLLLADIVTLSHKEMNLVRENKEMFKQAGFDFDEFGENTIKLTAVPSMCEKLNTKKLFLEILDEMDTVAVTAKQEKEDKFIATIASKVVARMNIKLDESEAENLIKKLLSIQNPFIYPNGRQAALKLTKADLEKKFSRR